MSKLSKKRKITSSVKVKRKTHSGAKKRLNLGPSKLTYMSIGTRHKLVNKSNDNKRRKGPGKLLIKADERNITKYFLVKNKSFKRRNKNVKMKKEFYSQSEIINSSDLMQGGTDVKS